MELNIDSLDYNYGLLIKALLRRGVDLKCIGDTPMILADFSGQNELLFDSTFSKTDYTSAWIASDKFYSKKFLEFAGIPTPVGGVFREIDVKKICEYAAKVGYPVVLKPLTSSHGFLVFPHIDSSYELEKAINFFRKSCQKDEVVLVEKYFSGQEYRLFVTRKGFFAVVNRIPANVTGDGLLSIKELIERENFRRMNPRANCLCTIKIDDVLSSYLEKQSKSLNFVPKKDENVQLRLSSNVAMGGNCFDVTDLAHDSVKQLAFDILYKLPGLKYVGVDLLCEDISKSLDSQKYSVCELNCVPGLSLHTVPERGFSRDSPGALVDIILD